MSFRTTLRRSLPTRRSGTWLVGAALLGLGAGGAVPSWQSHSALPEPRTEVAAAVAAGEIVTVGGLVESGGNTARADAYSIAADRWRRLPDLPVSVDHAAAASANGRVYVVGGYGGDRLPLRSVFVLERGSWRDSRACPTPGARPRRRSRAASSTSSAASTAVARSPGSRSRSTSGRGAGPGSPAPRRASTWPPPPRARASSPWAGAARRSTRTRRASRPTTRFGDAGRGWPRCPRPAAARAPRS